MSDPLFSCENNQGKTGKSVEQLSVSLVLQCFPFSCSSSLCRQINTQAPVCKIQSKLPPPCQTLQGKHYCLNCLNQICIIWSSDCHKNRDAKRRLTSEVHAQPSLCRLETWAEENSLDGWVCCFICSLPLPHAPPSLLQVCLFFICMHWLPVCA